MDFLRHHAARLLSLGVCTLSVACVPDLDSDESTIVAPRVIAVTAVPAEAPPGAKVNYRALVVDSSGTRNDGMLAWFYCNAQKPLAELGPVDRACLTRSAGRLSSIGRGASVEGTVPSDTCALYGPNLPQPEEGQEPGRPVDPDETGGYKQPVVLGLNAGQGDSLVLYEQRIRCDLAGVSTQVSIDYGLRYHANQNPVISEVRLTREDGEVLVVRNRQVVDLTRGEVLNVQARWNDCSEEDVCGDRICGPDESRVSCAEDCSTPVGCTGQERYLWFNGQRRALETRKESMRVAWYTNYGKFEDERTGVDEDAPRPRSDNTWTAPSTAGGATMWIVLRDARGGVGTFEVRANVR